MKMVVLKGHTVAPESMASAEEIKKCPWAEKAVSRKLSHGWTMERLLPSHSFASV